AALTNLRAGVYDGAGKQYRARANHCILTNNSGRMNYRHQLGTKCGQLTLLSLTNLVITDGNDNAIKILNTLEQSSGITSNRPRPILFQSRPGIIKKHHLV